MWKARAPRTARDVAITTAALALYVIVTTARDASASFAAHVVVIARVFHIFSVAHVVVIARVFHNIAVTPCCAVSSCSRGSSRKGGDERSIGRGKIRCGHGKVTINIGTVHLAYWFSMYIQIY